MNAGIGHLSLQARFLTASELPAAREVSGLCSAGGVKTISMIKRLVREPFLHFVLLGAAIFVAYHFVSTRSNEQPGKIIITQGDITSMVIGFSRTWQRPPTREELDSLVRDRVREEVYYREAIAMGLDRGDPVIRRRLQQKLQFVTEDVARRLSPLMLSYRIT